MSCSACAASAASRSAKGYFQACDAKRVARATCGGLCAWHEPCTGTEHVSAHTTAVAARNQAQLQCHAVGTCLRLQQLSVGAAYTVNKRCRLDDSVANLRRRQLLERHRFCVR